MSFDFINSVQKNKDGKLILVTAISPTPAGEGKTTTTVGLGDGLNRIGKKAMSCLREPSLGPVLRRQGRRGRRRLRAGRADGGHQPPLHRRLPRHHRRRTTCSSALLDNHIYWGNPLGLDARRIAWRRVMDMNDRALRSIVNSLGGTANGFPREDGFDITVASEVMAIFCLAMDLKDLERRLGNIVVGYTRDRKPVMARELKGDGAMTVLLKDALMPNLVQTLENNPVFIHGGPFANIAHGCNSVLATKTALKLCDYVVTEAGFGADLGAEKFFDIKCRKAGLTPSAAVIVATVRALKMHGGVAKDDLKNENVAAVAKGCDNLKRHIENVKQVRRAAGGRHQPLHHRHRRGDRGGDEGGGRASARKAFLCTHWADGGKGTEALAQHVVELCDSGQGEVQAALSRRHAAARQGQDDRDRDLSRRPTSPATPRSRRASRSCRTPATATCRSAWPRRSIRSRPIPIKRGAPTGHVVPVRELRLSAGAEFIVVITGEIMTMPGLPRAPAADTSASTRGQIEGLF